MVPLQPFTVHGFWSGMESVLGGIIHMVDDESTAHRGRPFLPTDVPLNCPYCGQKLVNVPSDGPTAYYNCVKDGLLMMPPDGRLRRAG
jgi:hypothetical protein